MTPYEEEYLRYPGIWTGYTIVYEIQRYGSVRPDLGFAVQVYYSFTHGFQYAKIYENLDMLVFPSAKSLLEFDRVMPYRFPYSRSKKGQIKYKTAYARFITMGSPCHPAYRQYC